MQAWQSTTHASAIDPVELSLPTWEAATADCGVGPLSSLSESV